MEAIENLATEILAIVDRMRGTLEKFCRFSPASIIYKKKGLIVLNEKQLTGLKHWLIATEEVYCRQVIKTRNLVSEEKWMGYEALGIKGLREQELLHESIVLLKDRWRNRPKMKPIKENLEKRTSKKAKKRNKQKAKEGGGESQDSR